MGRSPWQVVLGLLVGLVLLGLAARGIEFDQVWAALARARPLWFGLAFLSVLLTTAAKVYRWGGLFPGQVRPGLMALARALLIGQMGNALFPARLGDVARAYVAGHAGQVSKATALGTIAAEKAFDLFFFLLCGLLAVLCVPLPPWLNIPLIGFTSGGLLTALLVLAWPQRIMLDWGERLIARFPGKVGWWATGVLHRVMLGLNALHQPRRLILASAWSMGIWLLAASTNYLLFRALGLSLPPIAALALLVLLYAGVVPPSSPAKLGVFHSIAVLGLEAFGVERSLGLLYATVLHLLVYLPQIVPGALLLGYSPFRSWIHLKRREHDLGDRPSLQCRSHVGPVSGRAAQPDPDLGSVRDPCHR